MTAAWLNWRKLLLRALWYLLLTYICVGIGLSLYEEGIAQSAGVLLLIGSIAAGIAAYFWIARHLIERIADLRGWHPFLRDVVGLVSFAIVVFVVSTGLFQGTKLVISSFSLGDPS